MANVTVTVEEAGAGTDLVVLGTGRQAAADSKSLTLSTEDKTVLDAIAASLAVIDDVGRAAESTSLSVAISTEDKTALDAAVTALQLIDDAVATDDAAFGSTKAVMAGFRVDDTGTDSVDEGDAGQARMSANRVQYHIIRDNAGNERGANVDASGQLAVAGPVTNAGTFAVQVDGSALTSLQLIDDAIGTDDAAFGSTKVMMAGFRVDDSGTDSVDEGDVGQARMSANRIQYVSIRDNAGNERGLNIDASGQAAVTVAGDALTSLQLLDDTVFVDDTATHSTGSTKVLGIGMVATPTDAAVSANDIGMPAMSLNREMHVKVTAGGITSGTAGTASTDVVTVQGIASGIPVAVGGYPAARRTITFTTDTSAYASGDLIADTQQLDGFFRITDGTGMILDMTIFDKADQTAAGLFVLVHQTSTSMGTENSAPNISDANAVAGIIGVIPVLSTDWLDIGGIKVATVRGINMPVKAVSGTDDLYFSIVNSTGTPTFAADSLFASFGVALD